MLSKFSPGNCDDDRPFCDVEVFGKRFNCLLDSGASFCIAGGEGVKTLNSFGLKVDKNFGFSCIKTADDAKHKISGIYYVPIVFNGTEKVVEIISVPSLPHDLVLGVNFWDKFELTVHRNSKGWTIIHEPCQLDLFFDEVSLRPDGALVPRESLTQAQDECLARMIEKFRNLSPKGKLGEAVGYVHHIETGDAMPIKQPGYAVSPAMERRMSAELDRFLALGVVEPSNSPWCANVALSVKSNGSDRMCLDSRKLNAVSKKR